MKRGSQRKVPQAYNIQNSAGSIGYVTFVSLFTKTIGLTTLIKKVLTSMVS